MFKSQQTDDDKMRQNAQELHIQQNIIKSLLHELAKHETVLQNYLLDNKANPAIVNGINLLLDSGNNATGSDRMLLQTLCQVISSHSELAQIYRAPDLDSNTMRLR